MSELTLGQEIKKEITKLMEWKTSIFKVIPMAAWVSTKSINFFSPYSPNISDLAVINDFMNNFAIRITLKYNN